MSSCPVCWLATEQELPLFSFLITNYKHVHRRRISAAPRVQVLAVNVRVTQAGELNVLRESKTLRVVFDQLDRGETPIVIWTFVRVAFFLHTRAE